MRGAPAVCEDCKGLVHACPHCGALNRRSARFCVECGRSARMPQSRPTLHPAGQVREAIRLAADRNQGLCRVLGLPDGHRPFYWQTGPAGVFVFSHRDPTAPTRLDLLEGHALHAGRRQTLCEDLPPAQRWLSPPLISDGGVFIAAPDSLHTLRAHGGTRPFERVAWNPPTGQTIRAAGPGTDGDALVLTAAADGSVAITAVNGQDDAGVRRWSGRLDLAADQGAWIGAQEGGPLWVIAGGTRWLIAAADGTADGLASGHLRPVPAFWQQRLAEGLFEPVTMRTDGGRGQGGALAVPGQDRGIVLVRTVGSAAIRPIGRLFPNGWVHPDREGGLLLAGQEGVIACHGPAGVLWSLEVEAATQARAITAPEWLCVTNVRRGLAADVSGMATQIIFHLRSKSEDTAPRQHVSAQFPGQPVLGLPPLLVGDTLVLATRVPGEQDFRFLAVSIATDTGRTGALM